jgi:hypothetical protein
MKTIKKPQKFLNHPKLDITPWEFKEPVSEIVEKVTPKRYNFDNFICDKEFTVQPHIIRISELQVVTLLKDGKISYDNTLLSDPGNKNEPWYKCHCDVWMRGYQGCFAEGLFRSGGDMIYNGEVFYPCQKNVLKNKNDYTLWCEQLNTEDKKILDNAISKMTGGKEGG